MEQIAILELGIEDLPASMIKDTLNQLQKSGETLLETHRINYQKVSTWGSSQRLVFCIEGIEVKQREKVEKEIGPPRTIVYDSEGKLTPAGLHYLKAKKVSEHELGIETLEKGEYVVIKKYRKGKETFVILPSLFVELINSLKFSKSMRWQEGNFAFGRPLRYIVSILGTKVVEFEINGIKSGRKTKGHRYLAPEWIDIPNASDYQKIIRKLHVIPKPEERRKRILQQISRVILELQNQGYEAQLVNDAALLEELSYLTEYPTLFWGEFDSQYLSLPSFILKACLREYQKYFTIAHREKVLPFFIGIRDGGRYNLREIVDNNKRVLHARLKDARFFYQQDTKNPLENQVSQLKTVIVQESLGSYYEKIQRLTKLIQVLAPQLGCSQDLQEKVERAAYLCKADISTNMGREFPELQGILGKEYALNSGEEPTVAQAIEEHRKPRFPGDTLPQSLEGAILAIVDKLDTLSGAFWAGFIPSGSEDPWGLRREGQGIVEIVIDKNFEIDLEELIRTSMNLYGTNKRAARDALSEFLHNRIIFSLRAKGMDADQINAAIEVNRGKPVDITKRAKALQALASRKNFQQELVAIVRLLNILKQANTRGIKIPLTISPKQLEEKEEISLYNAWEKIKKLVDESLQNKEYVKAYENLVKLNKAIHTFFDEVLVMCDNPDLKLNRLCLLHSIGTRFTQIADFTRLQV